MIGPERRPEFANAALTYIWPVRGAIANLLALEVGVSLDLAEVYRRIHEAHDTLILAGPTSGTKRR